MFGTNVAKIIPHTVKLHYSQVDAETVKHIRLLSIDKRKRGRRGGSQK